MRPCLNHSSKLTASPLQSLTARVVALEEASAHSAQLQERALRERKALEVNEPSIYCSLHEECLSLRGRPLLWCP
jgi:hypothetical protein